MRHCSRIHRRQPAPAPLGLRMIAGIIDYILLFIFGLRLHVDAAALYSGAAAVLDSRGGVHLRAARLLRFIGRPVGCVAGKGALRNSRRPGNRAAGQYPAGPREDGPVRCDRGVPVSRAASGPRFSAFPGSGLVELVVPGCHAGSRADHDRARPVVRHRAPSERLCRAARSGNLHAGCRAAPAGDARAERDAPLFEANGRRRAGGALRDRRGADWRPAGLATRRGPPAPPRRLDSTGIGRNACCASPPSCGESSHTVALARRPPITR